MDNRNHLIPAIPGGGWSAAGANHQCQRPNALLLAGLERLRVVSIGLGDREDPQQIFESLNATGRPLTESEKVKNWLLMGLPDEAQQDLYENHWVRIERTLGAEHTTEPTDTSFGTSCAGVRVSSTASSESTTDSDAGQ